ncbi:E3 ubiquitin-protein ligase JMJ24-like isoform X2 [Actinidia eriantha]|uniref:E3 ubiquitin-protein ligase JMJ24-like isoform X2 n=1 Tax=Actinidia eriantha TaxID=165200 RepID=UPI002585C4B1|nr:E3 ubiquitin-protein ligase JMJ24-like isoform X2 [Actinidia eriantha]
MDHPRSTSGNGDDNVGIPDDLRCKRSDGKQWRCTAMSMPDKTVCEKHYIQAKKRAANSALRASMKKAKRKSLGESDIYLESKSDDMDVPIVNAKDGDYPASTSGKKYKEKVPKSQVQYSPETSSMKSFSTRNPLKANDDLQRDGVQYEENRRSYKAPPPSAVEPSENRSEKVFDASAMTETSDGSSDSSRDTEGQTCHQCRQNDRDGVIWCLRCDRRGYCSSCISTWYSDIPSEEIRRICPACRGTCNCKICLRGDNLVKARIREIPVQDKLQYLHCLLSSVLPVVKQINREQCFEWELEKKLRGDGVDLPRTKLNADEQMCCDCCRMPIIDYHRHCANCSYDLCLSCCKDLREASTLGVKGGLENQIDGRTDHKVTLTDQVNPSKLGLKLSDKFPNWKANSNASIPCPPKEYGGCGCLSLTLKRIFKTNWVAKLVKNSEEMVNGCKVFDVGSPEETGFNTRLCQCAHREDTNDNFLYCSTSEDIKIEGIGDFRKHWIRGEPVIVKEVCDGLSMTSWDPMVIWRGIRETTEEKMKDDNRIVKAIDCLDWSEIDIELGQFVKGYSDGRIQENGWQQMLKLKDWPSPSASEEFLLYQRPEFISKMPLLEYIHSKWGLLNVAAKLPHYSLQNDVGPKIFVSYGMYEELGRGDSVNNLHFSMCDMVYLLVHACEVKLKGGQRENVEKIQKTFDEAEAKESPGGPQISLEAGSPKLSLRVQDRLNEYEELDTNMNERIDGEVIETSITLEENTVNREDLNRASGEIFQNTHPGAVWDVFRRRDVPKLIEYLRVHWKDFGKTESLANKCAIRSLYDAEIFLNRHHKRKLKEEFGVEPWSFEQHLGQAVFIPAGCPFQVRNLQSTVQLGLDFLSPESLDEAVRLAEEIRSLPNDHEAKLQILEVRKMSLYAASSAIKEVQKLVLDPKLGAELGFEDPNLTSMVSENLEKMVKQKQIPCA